MRRAVALLPPGGHWQRFTLSARDAPVVATERGLVAGAAGVAWQTAPLPCNAPKLRCLHKLARVATNSPLSQLYRPKHDIVPTIRQWELSAHVPGGLSKQHSRKSSV